MNSNEYNDYIHKVGRISTLLVVGLFILVPIAITIYFNVDISMSLILSNTMSIAVVFGIAGFIEKLSLCPVIGPGAIYLSSSTGNVSNMKFPAAINAINLSGFTQNSEEADTIAILAVGSSAIVTTIIIFLGMLFLAPLVAPLIENPIVKPAFNNMFPALMGALVAPYVVKDFKLSVVPFLLPIIAIFILGSSYSSIEGFLLPVYIICSILAAYVLNKKQVSSNKN